MDLVLCRNVLIYLDRATVQLVAERLLASLTEDGWLLLGASDPMLSELVPCEVVVTGSGVAYRRKGARERTPTERRWASSTPTPAAEPAPPRPRPPNGVAATPQAAAAPALATGPGVAAARYRERDYAGVITLVRQLASREEPGLALRVLLVRSLANLGAHLEALATCERALESHRDSAELTLLRGTLLTRLGRAPEAVPVLRAALYLDRSLVMGRVALAEAYRQLPDRAAAVRELRSAERLLAGSEASAVVPVSDGLVAARLLDACRLQLRLLEESR